MSIASFSATASAVEFTPVTTGKLPQADCGSIERFSAIMPGESVPFIIDVWLPEGYSAASKNPVVYMADGQNLFDADKTFSFAGVAWEIEKKMAQLVKSGKIPAPAIVVGINNRGSAGLRMDDYFPEKALDYIPADKWSETYLPANFRQTCRGDEYAAFVAQDVKDFVDGRYSTLSSREHTFTMGSSMGGLISLYIMCEYPEIVGGAACMSTHWVGSISASAANGYTMEDDPVCARAILDYYDSALPAPGKHILYLDEGDQGWDAVYVPYNREMAQIAERHGYSEESGTLMVKYWTNSGHNEWYWQQHCNVPLEFLLSATLDSGVGEVVEDNSADGEIYDISGISRGKDIESLPRGIYCRKGRKFRR